MRTKFYSGLRNGERKFGSSLKRLWSIYAENQGKDLMLNCGAKLPFMPT